MTQIKICGINSEAAFDAVVEARADWLGFVFFPPSPRFVTPTEAARLSRRAGREPLRVGLFVHPTEADISAALESVGLDILQIYASPALVATMRLRFGLPVWRAVGISSRGELPATMDHADALLIEAKPPPGATRPGGNATPLQWSILSGWSAPGPWVLAGGLTPANVGAAIAASSAPAVDVSSGVERSPGVKDPALIEAFVAAARTFPDDKPIPDAGVQRS